MTNERLKDKTETVKNDWAPHVDRPLWITMSLTLLLEWSIFMDATAPEMSSPIYTSGSTFLKGKAHLTSLPVESFIRLEGCASQPGRAFRCAINRVMNPNKCLTKNVWGFLCLVVAVSEDVDIPCVKLYSQVVKQNCIQIKSWTSRFRKHYPCLLQLSLAS